MRPSPRNRAATLALVVVLAVPLLASVLAGCNGRDIRDPDKLNPAEPPRLTEIYGIEEEKPARSFWSWLPWVD